MQVTEEQIKKQFPEYVWYGKRFDKAATIVAAGGVAKHLFVPSGTVVFTVKGSRGDEFVDPGRSFCSCLDFFYRVMRKKEEACQHILAYQIAEKMDAFSDLEAPDSEYEGFIQELGHEIVERPDRYVAAHKRAPDFNSD